MTAFLTLLADPAQNPAMAIPTGWLLVLAATLFALGTLGFLIRRDLIVVFMSIELMLNATNLTFLAAARDRLLDPDGQVYAILVITVAAVEAAVGLAMLIAFFRLKVSLDIEQAVELEG
jgi:NADH-quinone oxidoreductase subunit K